MGKRREKHLLITKEDRELVRNSEVINNYSELKKVLDKYERIYETDFVDTDDFDDELINLILYVFQDIRDKAGEEWYSNGKMDIIESDNQKDWMKCALCGTPNKYIYYIVNRLNKTVLNVGSDCIDKFSSIDKGLSEGMTMEKLKRKQIKEYKKIKRKESFNKRFPDAEKMLFDWNREYYNLPIILPTELHRELVSIHDEGKTIYRRYVNSKAFKDDLYRFKDLINLRKKLMEKANKFIEKNKNSKFICTKEIYDWLIEKDNMELVEKIRDNYSIIPSDIVPFIYEDNFMQSMLIQYKNMFKGTKLSILRLEDDNIYFEFKDKKQRVKCELYISKRKFMLLYGKGLFEANYKIKEDEIFEKLRVVPTEENYVALIAELEKVLAGTDYGVKLDFEYMKRGLEFIDKVNNTYVDGLLINVFMNTHKESILLKGHNCQQKICRAIERIEKWRPLSDKDKFDIGNISKKPMQDIVTDVD